ncbi:flagellar hook-length control protein FliK [Shewanella sp. KT0246]|uniref:flagellar hook-length control protein FliK n=1 Tax=Shewanella sp. KT0246 TaxID=2815912 RepID=UPI001BC0D65C|nr:flagellar hook-length control protein FliK [Shewanella sp. KT0246]GIU53345.1 flagellar hook-length control protein FliK [Shewanella sp. KT0246]
MQQMSSILLGNSGKAANTQVAGSVQDAESKSFLSAFNQASQTDVDKTKLTTNAKTSAENSKESLSKEGDVELIFAQIGLAENFESTSDIEVGGKGLPSETALSLQLLSQGELSQTGSELALVDETQHSTDKDSLNIDIPVDSIGQDSEFLTASFLNGLSTEQLDALSQFSSMSEQELAGLSPSELNTLIMSFNQQTDSANTQALPLIPDVKPNAETATNTIGEDSIAESNVAAGKKGDATTQAAIPSNVGQSTATQVNTTQVNVTQANTTQTIANAQITAAQVTSAEKTIAEDKVISEAYKLNSKNADKDSTPVNLSKAELSVSLEQPTSKVAFNNALANAASNSTINGLVTETGKESDAVDSKSLQHQVIQNQSSLTPQHKSDVPQFQLSLRQGAESAVQMQDMIQKFAPVMKQQLITMVGQGVQHAEIRLDPAELGHMVVKVQVNGEQTQVQFQVAQSQTKDLIEQAIPKLRDMLAEEGLQLADSQVSQDGDNQQNSEYDEQSSTGDNMLDEISAQELDIVTKHAKSSNSAIDYYA